MSDPQVEQLIQENAQLRTQLARLRQENDLLRQKLDALARRYFGRKSEQLDSRQLEFLLGKLSEAEPPVASQEAAPLQAVPVRRRKKPRQPRCPDNVPVVTEYIDPAPVTENPGRFRQIDEEVSEQLDYEPGRFLRRRTVRRTWVKRNDPDAVPFTAPLPPKLQERGVLAPGLLAHILVSKYTDHLPLYRQEHIFGSRHGVKLPRQTMARGVELAADWLRPVVTHMLQEQLAGGYVQIDETPVKYLSPGRGKAAQGYFWVSHAPGSDTIYHWTTGRGHEHLLALLPESFRGLVQCDAYSAYPAMLKKRPNVEMAGCWAHVRRKFHAAVKQKEALSTNAWILRQIGHLYRVERRLRKSRAGPRLRSAIRCSESRPTLARLKRALILLQSKHRPQSLTGKAISYALGQWKLLEVYLEKGHVEIDNNLVENAIRPAALGRKNWLFIGDEVAGWRSAVIYSLIQSCKAHGVEPYAYLKDVLTRLPAMKNHEIPTIIPKAWAKSLLTAMPAAA
ncbi:MAG TPA: IS66 family transposase [Kiritimatiellia bacterium]|nr:IS66 family transposase [Kiritimatiellia bacterium]HMP00735.1 IS66 family transposase [Kiritimatiellia bacterium]